MELSGICKAALDVGNFDLIVEKCPSFLGGMMGGAADAAMFAVFFLFLLLIIIPIYIYKSAVWYTLAKKLGYENAWIAWIPIARWALILQVGGFHWAWVFLVLIPILGWIALGVLIIISNWIIFKRRNYPGWLCLFVLIPEVGHLINLFIIGFVAFKDKVKKSFVGKKKSRKDKKK